MKAYPRHEYPTPMFFKHVEIGADDDAFITTQFRTIAEGEDFVLDVNPDVPEILACAPLGNLLVAIWADDDGADLIASTAFRVDCEKFEVTGSWAKEPCCHNQLRNLTVQRAQYILAKPELVGLDCHS